MAKQSAPIQEVSRLLDLVPYLSSHSYISLKELAAEFGVDEKSMADELTALSMCGLPGYTPYELIEIFFDSGFVTINNHEALDIPRALTHLEVATLLIGLEILRDSASSEDAEIISKIDNLISQLSDLIGESILVEDDPQYAHRTVIDKAIAHRRSLEIEYLSPVRDEVSKRKVNPLSIEVDGGATYLIAYCHTQASVRNFRVDRIRAISLLDDQFQPLETASTPNEEKLSISLKVTSSRRSIAELFALEQIPPSGDLSVEIFSSDWAVKAVIAHSPDIQVVEPQQIRQKTLSELKNILALYAP
jgi:proteasome accessory factor C